MKNVGILAYGSLSEDPGLELAPLIVNWIEKVLTPFRVEFARKSKTRDYAPTLVPVESGGSRVYGRILVLESSVSLNQAEDLLWRRETGNTHCDKHYKRPKNVDIDDVVVERISDIGGLRSVIYAKIRANIRNISAKELAKLAIQSAKSSAAVSGKDGISYLLLAKRWGVITPLMPGYEREILNRTSTHSLEEALQKLRNA